jgi:3-hydroxyisobutyrate dehydrogenase-like beta-hydroxyacid dehydrogenase
VKVGFIGLGRMGQAMARRILDAGHAVVLYNRTPDKIAELVAAGAGAAASIAEAAAQGVVITMLSNDEALEQVARGPGGLIETLPKGGVHVVMGTHGVATVRALAEAHEAAGQVLVGAPVLGRPEAVVAGRLAIIAAGPEAAVAQVQPLFEAMGRRTFPAGGDPGTASAIKVANNFLIAAAIEAMGEAFSLVEKTGCEPSVFHDIITDGLFNCPAYTSYAKIISEKAYDAVGFTTLLALKDANLVLSAAEIAAVPMPTASLVRDRLTGAIAHGDGERDWAVLALEQARAAGMA